MDLEDTFKIADMLVNDPNGINQKAVGSWIREAGKRNQNYYLSFRINMHLRCHGFHCDML